MVRCLSADGLERGCGAPAIDWFRYAGGDVVAALEHETGRPFLIGHVSTIKQSRVLATRYGPVCEILTVKGDTFLLTLGPEPIVADPSEVASIDDPCCPTIYPL